MDRGFISPCFMGRLQSLDWTGGLDRWNGLDWTGLDWTGLDWTGLDWTGLDWTGLKSVNIVKAVVAACSGFGTATPCMLNNV